METKVIFEFKDKKERDLQLRFMRHKYGKFVKEIIHEPEPAETIVHLPEQVQENMENLRETIKELDKGEKAEIIEDETINIELPVITEVEKTVIEEIVKDIIEKKPDGD